MNITIREREVLYLVAEGLSNKQIGKRLDISDHTVRDHLSTLFRKFDVSNRVELAIAAVKLPKLVHS